MFYVNEHNPKLFGFSMCLMRLEFPAIAIEAYLDLSNEVAYSLLMILHGEPGVERGQFAVKEWGLCRGFEHLYCSKGV